MSRKLKVAVLMGGKSSEHEVSLMSGKELVKNLNPKKYIILPILISRNGNTWSIGGKKFNGQVFNLKSKYKIDIAFIALHGQSGEDGTIQGFLEVTQIPYTGSGVAASAIGIDKIYSSKLFTQAGLITPEYVVIKQAKSQEYNRKNMRFPVFVKPNNQGSSVGATKVNSKKDLQKALKLAFQYSDVAIVDNFIDGIEVTCAIIGNVNPLALPLIEIVPKKEFFDYEAKYNEKLCDEIIPARISKSQAKKAREAAIRAYQSIGCQGFGRVDMIIRGNKVYVLEVNTIPGLTPVSLFPKAAQAAGISYPQLLDKIIEFANP